MRSLRRLSGWADRVALTAEWTATRWTSSTGLLAGAAVALGIAAGLLWPAACGAEMIDFGSDQWVLVNAQVVEHLGRSSLMGTAYLDGVEFENGVIEVDIAVDGSRTYAGLTFRSQSPRDYEQFYIRPHRAGLYPDALQYTPVFNGISCWQLYNGEGYTAAAELPENEWLHLRLEVKGTQARVFLGDAAEPALEIHDLKHGLSRGTIGLYGRADGAAYFSNFSYRHDDGLDFEAPPYVDTPPGLITDWEISQPFQLPEIELDIHPDDQQLPALGWQQATPEPSGLVNVARYTGRTGRQPDCVIARAAINSSEAGTAEYLFGYSDFVSVFLNGEVLFSGNSAYQKRDPSFLGIVGLFDALYLPLREGENELLFIVAESFGGWAFMCQDAAAIYEGPGVSRVWETPDVLRTPESVVFDPDGEVFYVTNYDALNPSYGQGKQSIARISPTGEVENLDWATGLNNPTGMAVFGHKLYAVDRAGVVEIDTGTGEVLKRHTVSSPGFLNDITVDGSGNVYVSDSGKGVIYRRTDGDFEEWLSGSGIASPNGIHVAGGALLVGNNGDASLKSVDLATKEVTTVARLGPGVIDGVQSDDNGDFLVSHWEGRVYRITPAGEVLKILDTSVIGEYRADFEYVEGRGFIVIPTFFGNTVVAYRVD